MTIEKAAINYQPGTPDKCCAKCYQGETRLASGLWCNQFDCKTNPGGWCGVGGISQKVESVDIPGQIDLFS